MIEPANSVLLLVGREEFTPPDTFAGTTCVATSDCIAVGVLSVDDGPTLASFVQATGTSGLVTLGEFADGDTLTATITSGPVHGTATLTAASSPTRLTRTGPGSTPSPTPSPTPTG